MRIFAASAILVALTGCVSQSAQLQNDRGQVVQCANDGWGWLGAPVAAARQSNCIKKAKAAGYQQPGIPQAASSPANAAPLMDSGTKAPNEMAPKTPETTVAIQAIPSPSATPLPQPAPAPSAVGSPADRLKKLEDVYKSGLISRDEYERKRQEILSTL